MGFYLYSINRMHYNDTFQTLNNFCIPGINLNHKEHQSIISFFIVLLRFWYQDDASLKIKLKSVSSIILSYFTP